MAAPEINLKEAINAVSDVVQNRPRPLRDFDQIYMKTGDMVLQSELVASWSHGRRLAFIGDGDAISVCVALLKNRGIFEKGPSLITVFDFDQRICSAIERFADHERLETLRSVHYNCADAMPADVIDKFDCFYTNPPWGASNSGESVKAFMRRGFEVTGFTGEGLVVIADDHDRPWPQHVLAAAQSYGLSHGQYIQKMQSKMHHYHLDDDPELRSCNLFFKALPMDRPAIKSVALEPPLLANFYGKNRPLEIRYIKERKRVDYGKAHDDEYEIEPMETPK